MAVAVWCDRCAIPGARGWIVLALLSIVTFLSGVSAQGNVTLETLTIFRTHEWLGHKPHLYFQCKDERKIDLPDVKEKDHVYTFAGHESWQPLTAFEGVKCKRCGLYEKNDFLKDGVFDEWEFCPDGFGSAGRYVHDKEGEFNATFLVSDPKSGSSTSDENREPIPSSSGHNRTAITVLVVFFSFLVVLGFGLVAYTKWQKKKREEQQARFIKLFEEDDDFELELGL